MLFGVCAYMKHVSDDKYMYLPRTESFAVCLSAWVIEHATGNHKGSPLQGAHKGFTTVSSTVDHKGSPLQITYETGRQLHGTPEVIEEDGVEVAFGGAGKDGNDDFTAIFFFARFLQSSPGGCAAADANREAFFSHDAYGGGDSIVVGDGNDTVYEVYTQGVGDETGTESFYAVGTWATAG
jgi:hypothetical protein